MGETTWEEHCPDCGKINVRSQSAHDAGLGAYCWGCAGYPFCSCDTRHTGDCAHLTSEPTDGQEGGNGQKQS